MAALDHIFIMQDRTWMDGHLYFPALGGGVYTGAGELLALYALPEEQASPTRTGATNRYELPRYV